VWNLGARLRILRFLKRRGVITLVTAPGDGEVTVVTDETMGEKDPLLARLLAAATAGASPAGPAHKRAPVRIVLDPDAHPVAKGKLCGQHGCEPGHPGVTASQMQQVWNCRGNCSLADLPREPSGSILDACLPRPAVNGLP
jgi:hypothetical protein